MAEYLSPGVYVEEYDSGVKAMEGVGTSTAGFVGMAQKGPVRGIPVLITSMADYQRRFGSYLPERVYGEMRFLPYAVEQFFNNGGSTCYVMRVCPEGADAAKIDFPGKEGENSQPFLTLTAVNPGEWGNQIQVKFSAVLKNKIKLDDSVKVSSEGGFEVKNAAGYQAGDMVCLQYRVTAPDPAKPEPDPEKTDSDPAKPEPDPEKTDSDQKQPNEKKTPKTSVSYVFGIVDKVEDNKLTLKQLGDVPSGGKAELLYLAEWGLMIWDDTASEQYESVSFNPDRTNFLKYAVLKSQLVTAEAAMDQYVPNVLESMIKGAGEPSFSVRLGNGKEGEIKKTNGEMDVDLYKGKDGSPDQRTGLQAFKTLSDVSIMAIPGITNPSVQSELVSHCENLKDRFAILDMPLEDKEVSELQEFRENVDSSYAAMYHPWLQCYDSLAKRNVYLPPSGAVAGIYGRTDNSRGVHKAPANEVVRNCTGLSVRYNEAEQGKLNPKGINLIRSLPGQGIRVWGARTCSSDGNWKYINVRRLFIFIEESIKANTNWVVFEPNDETLWSRVEGTIRVFLTTQWRNGALAGSTADEAFFINIGKSTMTEDDILNGRLICIIGVAPVRPAEFVIFRITQKMENAQ